MESTIVSKWIRIHCSETACAYNNFNPQALGRSSTQTKALRTRKVSAWKTAQNKTRFEKKRASAVLFLWWSVCLFRFSEFFWRWWWAKAGFEEMGECCLESEEAGVCSIYQKFKDDENDTKILGNRLENDILLHLTETFYEGCRGFTTLEAILLKAIIG